MQGFAGRLIRMSWGARLLSGFFLVLAAVNLGLSAYVATAERRWVAYRAELAEAGELLTLEEVERLYATGAAEPTGAGLVEALSAELRQTAGPEPRRREVLWFGRRRQVDLFEPMSRRQIRRSSRFLDARRDLMNRLEALRELPPGRYKTNFREDPYMPRHPSMDAIRNATGLAALEGVLRIAEGNGEGAADSVELLFRISTTLSDEPSGPGRWMQMFVESVALRLIEGGLRGGEWTETALERSQKNVQRSIDTGSLRPALLGERAQYVAALDALHCGDRPHKGHLLDIALRRMGIVLHRPAVRANQEQGVAMFRDLLAAADDPRALIVASNALVDQVRDLPTSQALAAARATENVRLVTVHAVHHAELASAACGIAAERFRLRYGRFPTALNELVPEFLEEVSVDPFDGGPLRMVERDEGRVIYSVGENRLDDGGKTAVRERERLVSPDAGFRLTRLDRRGIRWIEDEEESSN